MHRFLLACGAVSLLAGPMAAAEEPTISPEAETLWRRLETGDPSATAEAAPSPAAATPSSYGSYGTDAVEAARPDVQAPIGAPSTDVFSTVATDAGTASAAPVAPVTYVGLANEAEALRLCERFLEKVVAGESAQAFWLLAPYFPVPEAQLSSIQEGTRQQHELMQGPFGQPLGYRFIKAETIQDTVLRYRFFEKFERSLVHWIFVFYKPDDAWILTSLAFHDDMDQLSD